jgi:adenylate cyclase
MTGWQKSSQWSLLVAFVLILIYTSLHYFSKPIEKIQLRGFDFLVQVRNSYQKVPASFNQIAVVSLDEDSFRRLDLRWPYQRDVYAELIKKISIGSPRLISFDFVFAGNENDQSDAIFSRAIAEAGHVILAAMISGKGELISSKDEFQKSALASGIINKPRDADESIRRARFFYESMVEGHHMWSWEALNAMQVLGINESQVEIVPRKVLLKGKEKTYTVPLLKDETYHINFRAGPKQIPSYSFWKVLAGQVNPQEFKDKIVLVGLTATGFHDIDDTPFGLIPGVYINANAIMTLLNQDYMKRVPFAFDLALVFLMALISGLVAYHLNPLRSVTTLIALWFAFAGLWLVLVGFNWVGS